MKYKGIVIAVKDIKVAREFYEKALALSPLGDIEIKTPLGDIEAHGAGKRLDFKGFTLQEDYAGLVGEAGFASTAQSNSYELCFEEPEMDFFMVHLDRFSVKYIHKMKELANGQHITRFYDPDGHIIQVIETMESVFRKLALMGMSAEEIAERTGQPIEYVREFIKNPRTILEKVLWEFDNTEYSSLEAFKEAVTKYNYDAAKRKWYPDEIAFERNTLNIIYTYWDAEKNEEIVVEKELSSDGNAFTFAELLYKVDAELKDKDLDGNKVFEGLYLRDEDSEEPDYIVTLGGF